MIIIISHPRAALILKTSLSVSMADPQTIVQKTPPLPAKVIISPPTRSLIPHDIILADIRAA